MSFQRFVCGLFFSSSLLDLFLLHAVLHFPFCCLGSLCCPSIIFSFLYFYSSSLSLSAVIISTWVSYRTRPLSSWTFVMTVLHEPAGPTPPITTSTTFHRYFCSSDHDRFAHVSRLDACLLHHGYRSPGRRSKAPSYQGSW
jgi:hypothetical protein